jgi:hypothetical protein
MNSKFKVGDIIQVSNKYTTALLISTYKSLIYEDRVYGKIIPLFNRFPIGKWLYESPLNDWKIIIPTKELIQEAKEVLYEALLYTSVDNLTYIEVLAALKQNGPNT